MYEDFIKLIVQQVVKDYSLNKKKSRSKKVKKVAPVHTHGITTELVKGCPLCQSHGNVMCLRDTGYEFVAVD